MYEICYDYVKPNYVEKANFVLFRYLDFMVYIKADDI